MDFTYIFKSKTRIALFRLYFTNPDQAYYLRELEKILDLPVSMIRKELVRLEAAGIFQSVKKGNLTYFSLHKSYPLYAELKSIVAKTIGINGLLKTTLQKIPKIDLAFIYGSYAKQEANAASDIDVFIIGNVDEDILIRKIKIIEKMVNREINYSIYSSRDMKKKIKERDGFIRDVINSPKIFLIGDANALRKYS